MATYRVKQGDTLGAIAKRFGVSLNEITGYSSGDRNLIRPNEILNIPSPKTASSSIKDNINLTNVKNATIETIPSIPDPTPEFAPVFETPTKIQKRTEPRQMSVLETLSSDKSKLSKEISDIESRIANSATQKDSDYETGGVYDDLKRLSSLKAEYNAAIDRETEIPIEARQRLRGQGATQEEFRDEIQNPLEQNSLDRLTRSREYSRYADAVNANIAQIDLKIKADLDRDTALLNAKNKRLEAVETQYKDILTEAQKSLLEDKKFENELLLESVKSDNSIRKELLSEIAKKGGSGIQLQRLAGGSLDDIYTYISNTDYNKPTNLYNLDPETAAVTLDPDQYAHWEKIYTRKDEAQTIADTQAYNSKDIVRLIDNIFSDEAGLDIITGKGFLGGVQKVSDFASGSSNKAKTNAKSLFAKSTLETLAELKKTGATLGALSEKELKVLQDARNTLGAEYDVFGNFTGTFNLSKEDFSKELQVMKTSAQKIYILSQIGKQAYDKNGYKGKEDPTLIQKSYDLLKAKEAQAEEDLSNEVSFLPDLEKIASVESGGDYNAVNPITKAYGKYQFIPSTLKEVAGQLGITEAQAKTPEGQEQMMALFTSNNIRGLQEAGFPANDFTIYAAHQQGLGGAKQILSGNISEQVKRNMLANLPQSARKTGDVRTDWINYYQAKLS